MNVQVEQDHNTFKVIILGETGVGKTSLAARLTGRTVPLPHTPTIGLDFSLCTVHVAGTWLRVNLWDTAGQERFDSLLPAYCRRCDGAIFVFDLTDLRTFLSLDRCLYRAHETLPDTACKLLVGNKKDLADVGMRSVTSEMAKEWANRIGARYVELSTLDAGSDVESTFTDFMGKIKHMFPAVAVRQRDQREPEIHRKKSRCCS